LKRISAAAGITTEEANEWVESGSCGLAGERLLPFIRQSRKNPRQFAVGFVSAMAGTMLASEAVKDTLGCNVPLSDHVQRALFQFWNPSSQLNCASAYL